MFWKKPFVLLGLLAGLGSTVPSSVKRGEKVDPYDVGYEDDVYFRSDRRGHAEIKAAGGFKAWAGTNKLPPNLSLWDHCKVKEAKHGFGNLENDGFVGMSTDMSVNIGWVKDYIEKLDGTTTIYKIAQDRNILACQDILKHHSPISAESEYVAIGEIPWDQVIGWMDDFKQRGEQVTEATCSANPDYNQAKYAGHPYGTDESAGANELDFLPLAGWPKNDKRWKEKPWNKVAPANCGSKKRSVFGVSEDFEDEEVQLVAKDGEDMQLMPRARGRGSSRKRPAIKRPTKKRPTKKPATTKPGKKCTAAMKKQGKCGTTSTKCNAAIKKKNGGRCPVKTPVTCSAAAKKQNGGVCPATCSAAIKKKNGGVCPPTCTAAEKKKNGGVCPPKSCPLPKTNGQLAQEYVKKYKAGTLGKGKGKSTTQTGGKKKVSV